MNQPPSTPPTASPDFRLLAAFEIALVLAFTLGHRVFKIIPIDETWLILALGWLSVWRRRIGWRGVGLTTPRNWLQAIGLGVATGAAMQLLSLFVTEPLFARLTGTPADVSKFRPLVGNLRLVLVYFAAAWLLGALREELAYRGYLLNRVADLFGRGRGGWAASLVVVSLIFAAGHSYQGFTGMLDIFVHALILGGLYLATGRNLWPVLIAHGISDTIALGLVYFGVL